MFPKESLSMNKIERPPRLTPAELIASSLNPDEIGAVARIAHEFESKEFQGLIDQGQITVAMVRPQANESKLGGTDGSAAQHVIDEIKTHQDVVFEFSCVFSREMCEHFYAGLPMETQQSIPGIRTPSITRWEEFVQLMTSGPSTVLTLYSQDGTAVQRWREQVGALKNSDSDPSTIRGKFGLPDDYNNLVHGSDSIESVRREIQFFRDYLAGIATSAKK